MPDSQSIVLNGKSPTASIRGGEDTTIGLDHEPPCWQDERVKVDGESWRLDFRGTV